MLDSPHTDDLDDKLDDDLAALEATEAPRIALQAIRNPYAVLIGLIFILLATLRHSFLIYAEVTEVDLSILMIAYIVLMLISVEYSVMIFSVHGQKAPSAIFSILIGLLNLYYFWHQKDAPSGFSTYLLEFVPGLIYSAMFSYSLYYFSETFASYIQEDRSLANMRATALRYKKSLIEKGNTIRTLREQLAQDLLLHPDFERVEEEKKEMAIQLDTILDWMIESEQLSGKTRDALLKQSKYHLKNASNATSIQEERYAMFRHFAALRAIDQESHKS